MKLLFVVPRYGLEVNGGAELLCREVAEHLVKYYVVEVATTCAIDYMSWKNEYTEGVEEINNVKVRRFKVDLERDVKDFNRYTEKIINKHNTEEEEEQWMDKQGPNCPQLIQWIKENHQQYDLLFFVPYLYYTTYWGAQIAPEKSILIPAAHDEPFINLKIHEKTFTTPKAIIYLTNAEKEFVNQKFKNQNTPNIVGGMGVEIKEKPETGKFKEKYNVDNYILYAGRIDESKGCKQLIEYFLKYIKETEEDINLVLVGKEIMQTPKNDRITATGYISEQDKINAMADSQLMVLPSPYESLSISVIEAWLMDKAVLVNGNCTVLKEQAIRSNGGLYYSSYEEFKECLNIMLTDKELTQQLADNGKKYAQENYTWDKIEEKYKSLIDSTHKN